MKCPHCGAWSFTLETRWLKLTGERRRRYECANGHRFTTVESVRALAGHRA